MAHTIERAKSGRAKCRKCREKIEKDEYRFGREVSGEFGDTLQWYHLKCAAQKVPIDLESTLADCDEQEIPDRAGSGPRDSKQSQQAKADDLSVCRIGPLWALRLPGLRRQDCQG